MATNYTVNYDDKRFQEVENQEATALKEVKGTYDNMINESQGFYQQQIDASKEWANTQSELQQAQTDLAIEKVEQAKDQAEKQYTKEQKGAYTDYQKATNQYGANAEQLATQGLNQTGYSESTRTNAYNTYQNRYATARESYNQAILNYDNSIKEAQLANNSALATIAYEALQQQLELSLQGFQYKNQLLLQKVDAVNQTKDRYYQRWQNVQQQINTENALAEQVRQYNESLAEQQRQYNESKAMQEKSLAEQIRQYNETMAFNKQKQAQEQANWEKEYALAKSAKSSSSGSTSKKQGSASLPKEQTKKEDSKSLPKEQSTKKEDTKVDTLSRGFTQTKRTALSLKLSAPGNKRSAVESYLAQARAKNTITKAEAQRILKDLGY